MKKIKLLTVVAFLGTGVFLSTPAKAKPTYDCFAGELYMTRHVKIFGIEIYTSDPIATGASCTS